MSAAAAPVRSANDRRMRPRMPYSAPVAVLMIEPTGQVRQPMILRARDLSATGIRVISPTMLYPGSQGAAQLQRDTGDLAMIGVQVRHCRYVGAMKHEIGLRFAPLPQAIPPSEFLDEFDRMKKLAQNNS